MFNAPRRPRQQGGASPFSSYDPLVPSSSTSFPPMPSAADIDPWSNAPSPARTPAPAFVDTPAGANGNSGFASSNANGSGPIIDEALLGEVYIEALERADPGGRGEGGLSVVQLGRILRGTGLGSSDLERIANIVSSSKPRITKSEFLLGLVLAGLAQEGQEPSLDTAIRRRSNPPSLSLDFASLDSASSRAILPDASSVASSTISSTYAPPARSLSPPPAPVRQSSSDPWASASTPNFAALSSHSTAPFGSLSEHPGGGHGDSRSYPSSLHASPPAVRGGLLAIPRWWEKEIRISVRLVLEREGKWPGLKWTVYEIETAGGRSVKRRFSEFVWLHDCLIKRYPFRCIVALPPKRLGADGSFLEQRRRSLQRYLNFVANHPTLKADHLVQVFLSEPNLEVWRKNTPIALDEEGKGKRLTDREEQSIPDDSDQRLAATRTLLLQKIASWQSLTSVFERNCRRLEAQGADASRFAFALSSLVEASVNEAGGGELAEGVRGGLRQVAGAYEQLAGVADARAQSVTLRTLEALKAERDLYLAFRELCHRFDRLSPDPVPKLEKKIEAASMKLTAVRLAKKVGWEVDADKIAGTIEADQAAVIGWMNRRGVVRSIMWQELAFLLHPRENTLLTLAFQQLAREERAYAGDVEQIWRKLEVGLEEMPLE